ncbi:MAG: hypothetical protein AAGG08_01050 [Actinomycetota bacterium]
MTNTRGRRLDAEIATTAFRWAVERVLRATGALLPAVALRGLVRLLVGERRLALCFHRVRGAGVRLGVEHLPEFTHDAGDVDEIIDLFGGCRHRPVMGFDDGYLDAVAYVRARAARHTEVEWMLAVCPDKTIGRRGFTWDDWVVDDRDGVDRGSDFIDWWEDAVRRGADAARGSIGGADRDGYRLATIEECRELARLDNVTLADHTDRHLPAAWLGDDDLLAEYVTSREAFERAFGPTGHVVLPFGAAPWVEDHHVAIARGSGDRTVWTVGRGAAGAAGVIDRVPMASTDLPPRARVLEIALRARWSPGRVR